MFDSEMMTTQNPVIIVDLRLGLTVVAKTRFKSATHSFTVENIFAFSSI